MKKIINITLILLIIGIAARAQEKIYMPYFEVINIHEDYQVATTRLLKLYIEGNSQTQLYLPELSTPIKNQTKEDAMAIAKTQNIKHIIIGELNRVGETVIVSLSMFNTENGVKEWSTIQKAQNPDDLDPIMQKIAFAINNRHSNVSAENIYNVTDYNAAQLNKMNATTNFGVEIGGGPVFLNAANNFPAGLSFMFSGDMRDLIFDIKGSLYFSDIRFTNLSLIVNYPLTKSPKTPYLNGGIGFGATSYQDKTDAIDYRGNGLTFYGGAGYLFNRTSNISLRLNADLFFSSYQVKNTYPAGIIVGIIVLL